MSGIAVVAGSRASAAAARRMLEAAPHRGAVLDVHEEPGVAAGTQGAEGADPVVGTGLVRRDGVLAVVAGCLYEGDGVVSGDDAAARVAEAYLRDGRRAVAEATGSFAAVVAAANELIAYRSPPGERPLFVRRAGESVAAASEPKALRAAPFDPPGPDTDALLDLVAGRHEFLDRTPLRGTLRVLPGQVVTWDGTALSIERTWDPSRFVASGSPSVDEAVEGFRSRLETAVARRLRAGTGLLLSGGLDSTAIGSIAAPLHRGRSGEPLQTLSAAYPAHPEVDETRYIEACIAAFGCRGSWVRPQARPFEDIAGRARLHDGVDIAPMSSNFRQILSAARRRGLTVLLDGHDGDTVLGRRGNVSTSLLRRGRLGTLVRHAGFVRERFDVGRAAAAKRVVVPAVWELAPWAGRAWRTLRRRGADGPSRVPAWVQGPLRARMADPSAASWEETEALGAERMLPLALENIERQALTEGVTLIHPLSDPQLVDFLLRLPAHTKLATGETKALVRLGCPEIPAEVRGRADKTLFDAVGTAGFAPADIRAEIDASPQVLEGVDWKAVRRRPDEGPMKTPEWALLARALTADRYLGAG